MTGGFRPGANLLAGVATRLFGWTPDQFWQATPAEMATILNSPNDGGGAPLSRAELHSLMERDKNGQ